MLNALVGDEIAPTDATECTRVVTWFQQSPSPRIDLTYDGGRHRHIPVHRADGKLRFDLDGVSADRVERLAVGWPSSLLDRYTLIDTPGTSSNSRDVSARTLALLMPENGQCEVDAVVYLMRDLQAADIKLLRQIRDYMRTGTGPLGILGVLSRADEVHGGRDNAISEAQRESQRIRSLTELEGLHQFFLPVSGLLALRGQTLRQREFDALRTLASLSVDDLQAATISADRFVNHASPLPIGHAERVHLANAFGLFGIRAAVSIIRGGVGDAAGLASELLRRSGLAELQRALHNQFGERAAQMRAHSALHAARRLIDARSDDATTDLVFRMDRALTATDPMRELQTLSLLRSGRLAVPDRQVDLLERVLGGAGIAPTARLALPADAGTERLGAVAMTAVRHWREQSRLPGLDGPTERAFATATRSAEAIVQRRQTLSNQGD
jgi:hypothetical protein